METGNWGRNGSCGGDKLRSVAGGEERGVGYFLLHPRFCIFERVLFGMIRLSPGGELVGRGCDWGEGEARGEIETRLGWALLFVGVADTGLFDRGYEASTYARGLPDNAISEGSKDLESIVLHWFQLFCSIKASVVWYTKRLSPLKSSWLFKTRKCHSEFLYSMTPMHG